jgi:hypothetical protein
VIEILTRTGRKAFPDVIVVDSAKDLADMLSRYRRSQHIPQGRGAVGGLDGAFGFRFAQARVRMCGS